MVDEMDLLSGLKAADPVRPHAFEEARAVLRAAMAIEGVQETAEAQETAGTQETAGVRDMKSARRRRARWSTRRTAGVGVVAVGAAAAAVALVVTSTSAPSHNTAAIGTPSGKATPTAKATPAAVNPVLTQLAANITVQQVKLPGNATMEIRNQSPTSDKLGDNGVDLYTDSGTYYWALSESMLPQVIAEGQDVGQGQFKRDIAAALYAVNGNIDTARARMAIANLDPGVNPNLAAAQGEQAEISKLKALDKEKGIPYTPPKPLTPAQKQEQTDNSIWMNSIDALTATPGNPQVRPACSASWRRCRTSRSRTPSPPGSRRSPWQTAGRCLATQGS